MRNPRQRYVSMPSTREGTLRIAAFAAALACAAAQSSLPHGGVEDKNGNRIPGATTPGQGVYGVHHMDLMFKTLLCVAVAPFSPPALAPCERRGCAIAAALTTRTAVAAAQRPEHADVHGGRSDGHIRAVRRLRHVGHRRRHRQAAQEEEEDADWRWREGRFALTRACRWAAAVGRRREGACALLRACRRSCGGGGGGGGGSARAPGGCCSVRPGRQRKIGVWAGWSNACAAVHCVQRERDILSLLVKKDNNEDDHDAVCLTHSRAPAAAAATAATAAAPCPVCHAAMLQSCCALLGLLSSRAPVASADPVQLLQTRKPARDISCGE